MASDRLRTESSHDYIWENHRGILKKFPGYLRDGNYTNDFQGYTYKFPSLNASSIAMTPTELRVMIKIQVQSTTFQRLALFHPQLETRGKYSVVPVTSSNYLRYMAIKQMKYEELSGIILVSDAIRG